MPIKDITLYLDHSAPLPVVEVAEADTAWTFQFTVMHNNAVYAPNVSYVIMAGHKPDGNAFAYLGNKSGNMFSCSCKVQMTACPGDALCTLHLLGPGNTGLPFILRVRPGAAGTDKMASVTALPAYTTILSQLGDLVSQAGTIPSDVAGYITDWLAENISDGAVVDQSLTVSGAAADAKETGDRLAALDAKIFAYWLIHQTFDSSNPASPSDMPVNSYTYTSGARLGSGWFEALDAGKYYFVYCYANHYNPSVRHYQAFERDSGNVYEGYTADSGATVSWARAGEDEEKKGLEYWYIHQSHDSSNPASPSDMPINSYFYTGGSRLGDGWFDALDAGKYYFIYCHANMYNPAVRHYQAFEKDSGNVYEGYTTNSGAAVSWAKASGGGSGGRGKTLKVLSIGSSFGQDCTVYAPWLIEEMDSGVSVVAGIVYMSGGTINQFNGWLDDDTALNYYKREEGADAWASGVQKTLKQVLDDEAWDIILVNQSAANGGDWTTFSNLETYLEKIVTYIGQPVKLGYLMPQVALGASNPYTYSDLIDCAQKAFNGSVVSFVIPAGTAIENARNTSLNSVGDRPGGLAADELGHLQEGLPVLIANYVTAAKLLEVTQGGIDKIMGCTLTPTTAWVTSHNIPGVNPNPVSATGVTAANILLGQRCAVQAVKKPYEVSV